MPKIRLAVIEDSAFVRKVLREMLANHPGIEVVGHARNGLAGLEMVEELKPDVVTCDLNMPELDGVQFVRRQMARRALPILILTASPQDADHVLEALQAGAVDFIRKPTALANEELLRIREELFEKILAAAHARSAPAILPHASGVPRQSPPGLTRPATNFDIVVLGISTGGPQALRFLIPQFPSNFPVPVAIVLHMPVGYTAVFAERLAEISQLRVIEAYEGCPLQPGTALVAQAGKHLLFRKTQGGNVAAHLSLEPDHKLHRPSVDVLFRSASEIYGRRTLGVVMTGMGDDGAEGAAWIKAQGGLILTQDENSCIIYGMPRSVAEAGLSDASVPLDSMAVEISKRI
jgi:two-component system chemotaxis response regulator CheB